MLVKVKPFDKSLIKEYLNVLSVIGVITSFVSVLIDIPDKYKLKTGGFLFLFFFAIYIIVFLKANLLKKVKLKINNSTINIKIGDIFKENSLKVIAFNEYFDTQVDNKIISEKTLNGIYIKKYVQNIQDLDNLIENDDRSKDKIIDTNESRRFGKKKKYKLGTLIENNEYLLTAFSRFDEDNRAYLYMNDFVNFLLNFWNEIDIIYSNRSVSIPLLGSGITRFKEYNMISEQELLELIIWSFKISKIKFTYPSQVSIIIHKPMKDKINFYKLKGC